MFGKFELGGIPMNANAMIKLLGLGMIFGLSIHESAQGDDAQVLPQGRFRARLITAYTNAQNEYSAAGESTSLGATFTRKLDSKLLSAINPTTAETIKKLNAVSPGLGDEIAATVSTRVESEILSNVVCLEYGFTDRLSAGFILPIVHGEVRVASEASPDSSLEAKINSMSDLDPRKKALQQVAQNLSTQNFQNILTQGYGYQDGLRSWSGSGLGDLELGSKYQYYRDPQLQMTIKSGLRLPTGTVDNPDQLFDVGFGDGQMDLGAYHLVDYKITPAFGTTLEAGYVVQLADSSNVRLPISADLPVSNTKQKIDRDLGDYANLEGELNYKLWKALTLSARYRFYYKFADEYKAPGLSAALLEAGTQEMSHGTSLEAEYTNLTAVRAGREKFPYAVGVFFRMPFAGENIKDSRTTGLSLKAYF